MVERSVNETSARRLFEGGGGRGVFPAVGAAQLADPFQVILRRIAVALFELPQPVILPGLDVVRVGLQRALVPDLRNLVVAELAIGVADQIGDVRAVVPAERLQLPDGRGVIVAVVYRGVSRAITLDESFIVDGGALTLFVLLGA